MPPSITLSARYWRHRKYRGASELLRLTPAAARAWRNDSDAPLYFLCLQYRADGVIEGGTADGQKVEGKPAWPDGQA